MVGVHLSNRQLMLVANFFGVRPSKDHKILLVRICAKYSVALPPLIFNDGGFVRRFIDTSFLIKNRSKEEIELHVIKCMKKTQRRRISRQDRNSLHDFRRHQITFVRPTDWKALEVFFDKEEMELRVISGLPGKSFYKTREWRSLRYFTIKKRSNKCECCGIKGGKEAAIHVDHILPRSKFPEHALNPTNLQILCELCNVGKSNSDQTDWRLKKEGI